MKRVNEWREQQSKEMRDVIWTLKNMNAKLDEHSESQWKSINRIQWMISALIVVSVLTSLTLCR